MSVIYDISSTPLCYHLSNISGHRSSGGEPGLDNRDRGEGGQVRQDHRQAQGHRGKY